MTAVAQNADGSVALAFDTPAGSTTVTADRVILTLPFPVLRTLDYRAGRLRRAQADGDRAARRRLEREAAAPVHEPLLEHERRVGHLERRLLHRPRLPEHLGDDARASPAATGILVNYTGGSVAAALRIQSTAYSTRRRRTPRSRATHARSCASSRSSSPASPPGGTARRRSRRRPATRTCSARTRTGARASTPRSAATRASRRARSTSPASTARRTSRATWKAAPARANAPRSRSGTR